MTAAIEIAKTALADAAAVSGNTTEQLIHLSRASAWAQVSIAESLAILASPPNQEEETNRD